MWCEGSSATFRQRMNTARVFIAAAVIGFAALVAGAAEVPAPANTNNITHASASEAAKLLAEKKVVVIDVRTPDEFSKAHIAGAKLVDISDPNFEEQIGKLDRNQTHLVHCQSGGRSTRALKTFSKLGFKSVVHLDGGMNAWLKAGQPVQK